MAEAAPEIELATVRGRRRPVGQPLSNAELMKLGPSDLASWFPPPPLRGEPLSNAELMKLGDADLMCEAKPIVDNIDQRHTMDHAGHVLEEWYADREDVTVGVDLGLYYLPRDERGAVAHDEGDQLAATRYAPFVVPDVMVAFGVRPGRHRSSYQTWNDGKVPDFVLEVVSKSTWRRDYVFKRDLYERLGIKEYFIYDGRDNPRRDRLTAYQLDSAGRYRHVRTALHEGLGVGIRSELLGLVVFVDEATELGWWDPVAKRVFPSHKEVVAALAESETALAESEAARERLEREAAALRAELSALRATDAGSAS